MPKIIDSPEISVGDPLVDDLWPIFDENFSAQKFCEWRIGIKRVNNCKQLVQNVLDELCCSTHDVDKNLAESPSHFCGT